MTTTTDLAVPQQGGPLAFEPTPAQAVSAAIEQWVGGLAASVQGAEYIVDTPLCPDSLWPLPPGTQLSRIPGKNPKVQLPNEDRESFLARRRVATYSLGGIVRYGLQLGIPPEVATQGLFPIGGRISMYADQMVALVKSHGHKHRIVKRTREFCTIEVQRIGEEPQEFTYTIDDAIENGYVPGKGPNENLGTWPDGKPKTGGNDKYLTDPAGMLEARCNSTALTAVFPDILRGLVTREAMEDEQRAQPVEVRAEVVEPAEPPRARAAAVLAAAVQAPEPVTSAPAPERTTPAPEAAPVVQQPPTPAPASAPINKQQWDAINARFAEIGVRGKDQQAARLVVMRAILHVPGLVSKDLTAAQAQTILEDLEGDRGVRLVAHVLTEDGAPAHLIPVVPEQHDETPSEPADDREAADPGYLEDAAAQEGDQADDDPYADYDPTMDGAEAEAEGR